MDNDKDRYFDFSTDERDLRAFQPGADTHPRMAICAEEIQKYLGFRNPIVSIRGLMALHTVTSVGVAIVASKSRTMTNSLLTLIAILLAYIAYVLT